MPIYRVVVMSELEWEIEAEDEDEAARTYESGKPIGEVDGGYKEIVEMWEVEQHD